MKEEDYTNNQTNDNAPNSKLKSLYNEVKAEWILNYETTTFLPHHMKSIFVEAWNAFNFSDIHIIRDIFVKTKLPPLVPTNLTTDNQTCATSIQVYSGFKDEKINKISRHIVAHIEVHATRTDGPIVVIQAKGSK